MKKQDQVKKRLRALADALSDEAPSLSCEACREHLPALVEAEMEGERVSTRFAAAWNHLLTCEACGALYADLLEVTMLEESGEMPAPDQIPAPDLSFLPSPVRSTSEWITRTATAILEQLAPGSLDELASTVTTFFDHVAALEGRPIQVRSASDLALAFGAERSPELSILAATYNTTQFLLDKLEPEDWPPRLTDRQARQARRTARIEGRHVGLDWADARAFARAYVEEVERHLDEDKDDQEE